MLFNDKLQPFHQMLNDEFDRLFEVALSVQHHTGDLLLWSQNGFHDPSVSEFTLPNGQKLGHYMMGPGNEGLSEMTHYRFINHYRNIGICKLTFEEYKKLVAFTPERMEEIDKLETEEQMSVQVEMLIYLKFWESDMIIKKLYQLTRLLNGEHYDWHFKIAESNRDPRSTGIRHEIIRKSIRDKIKKHSPIVSQLIQDTYKTQLRNAIAHSNYSLEGRHILLNNFIENDQHAQNKALPFDEWIDIFHKTLALFNGLIQFKNRIDIHFTDLANETGKCQEIQVIKKNGDCMYDYFRPRVGFNLWERCNS